MEKKDNEIIIPWHEAPAKATTENPYREGPALTKRGKLLGRAPEIDTDDESKKRTVLDYYDLKKMVPFFDGKPKLVHALMKLMKLDNVNYLHHRNLNTPGAAFVRGLLDDFHITMRVDGADVLNNLPEGAFITVSNHPFGALDGIMLHRHPGNAPPTSRQRSTDIQATLHRHPCNTQSKTVKSNLF